MLLAYFTPEVALPVASVVAAAFGFEEGDLLLPIEFATPGRKRVVFSLLTDERQESDRERMYIEVAP